MPFIRLRRRWSPKIVLPNVLAAGLVGLAAVRVAQSFGASPETASALAGSIGYMGAMTVEFIVMCVREHYARKGRDK